MVVFDEAGPVSSLLLTQRHLHSARVGETFQTKHWTQHQSDCLSSRLADWLYLRIWWRGESRGDTLVRTLSIVSGDTQTGAQRLNHSLLSLSSLSPRPQEVSTPPLLLTTQLSSPANSSYFTLISSPVGLGVSAAENEVVIVCQSSWWHRGWKF